MGESVEQALPKGSEPDGRRLRTGRTGGAGLHDYQKYDERFRKISTFHLRKVPLLLVGLLRSGTRYTPGLVHAPVRQNVTL